MQFTTDEDEEFEEVVGEMESVAATLGQGEALARSSQPVNYAPGKSARIILNSYHHNILFVNFNRYKYAIVNQAATMKKIVNKRLKPWCN